MASGTRTDPLGAVRCEVGPPWIRADPAHPVRGCSVGLRSGEFGGKSAP